MDVVDGFALTDRQCWATEVGDGRHYVPLLPSMAMSFIGALFPRELLPRPEQADAAWRVALDGFE